MLVGALNVGSISIDWLGELPRGHEAATWQYDGDTGPRLDRGADLGCFNLGSTAILLLPGELAAFEDWLKPGATVRVGQRIATLRR